MAPNERGHRRVSSRRNRSNSPAGTPDSGKGNGPQTLRNGVGSSPSLARPRTITPLKRIATPLKRGAVPLSSPSSLVAAIVGSRAAVPTLVLGAFFLALFLSDVLREKDDWPDLTEVRHGPELPPPHQEGVRPLTGLRKPPVKSPDREFPPSVNGTTETAFGTVPGVGLSTVTDDGGDPGQGLCPAKWGGCPLLFPAADVSDHRAEEQEATAKVGMHGPQLGWDANPIAYGYAGGSPPGGVAVLSRRGDGPGHEINQDRSFVMLVPPTPSSSSSTTSLTDDSSPRDFIVGLFDGHGDEGHITSHYAAEVLPAMLSSRLGRVEAESSDDSIVARTKEAIRGAVLEVHESLGTRFPAEMEKSGSTGILLYRRGSLLHIANTGDSLAFVVVRDRQTGKSKIKYRTTPHKPDQPEERTRIEASGGTVIVPPPWVDFDSPRVLLTPPKNAPPHKTSLALAMSRSIGDYDLKAAGVIAEPAIDTLDVDFLSDGGASDVFVVAATDGLFDHVPPDEIAERVSVALYSGDGMANVFQTMESIIKDASVAWWTMFINEDEKYRDDITLAVSRVDV